MPEWHEITIPSTPKARQEVERVILKLVNEHGFSREAVFSIKLAMEEAVTNAIKHGNRFDRSKNVLIRWNLNHSTFTVCVRDEGQGFDPASIPDCTAPEYLNLPYGRGLMLMRAYMDCVEFSPQGNEVKMVKKNR